MKHILVALFALRLAVAEVVCEKVVAVGLGDGAVEIGEEDEFGVGFHGGEVGGGAHGGGCGWSGRT